MQERIDWILSLALTQADRNEIAVKSGMLTDRHIYAAHKLLHRQFPHLEGCFSTLLIQLRSFPSITSDCRAGSYV